MKTKARVIAFYLPQFYPFKENDEWWGKGFTEWTNVGKAKPLFRGHYQPRVPADLGYYDLRLPEVREQQAEMAREAGVEGFMYWHYWFGGGRTLLRRVFDEVLASGKPDFPFCLGWANHDWSRRTWNVNAQYHKDQMLMEQTYPGDDDHKAHFMDLLPAFRDKRYITVDGKPLFYIYNPMDIPQVGHFMDLWRQLARQNGLPGIHFVAQSGGWESKIDAYRQLGAEAIATSHTWQAETAASGGYIPKMLQTKLNKYFPRLAPMNKHSYEHIIRHWFSPLDREETVYPYILCNYDRSPRGGRRAQIYVGSTPELFFRHAQQGVEMVAHKEPEHRIIMLKSWNEWAEGNYMEPDLRFGHGYLDALRRAVVIN